MLNNQNITQIQDISSQTKYRWDINFNNYVIRLNLQDSDDFLYNIINLTKIGYKLKPIKSISPN